MAKETEDNQDFFSKRNLKNAIEEPNVVTRIFENVSPKLLSQAQIKKLSRNS